VIRGIALGFGVLAIVGAAACSLLVPVDELVDRQDAGRPISRGCADYPFPVFCDDFDHEEPLLIAEGGRWTSRYIVTGNLDRNGIKYRSAPSAVHFTVAGKGTASSHSFIERRLEGLKRVVRFEYDFMVEAVPPDGPLSLTRFVVGGVTVNVEVNGDGSSHADVRVADGAARKNPLPPPGMGVWVHRALIVDKSGSPTRFRAETDGVVTVDAPVDADQNPSTDTLAMLGIWYAQGGWGPGAVRMDNAAVSTSP